MISYFENRTQFTLVEPLGACLWAALIAGKPVKLDKVDTFATVLQWVKLVKRQGKA